MYFNTEPLLRTSSQSTQNSLSFDVCPVDANVPRKTVQPPPSDSCVIIAIKESGPTSFSLSVIRTIFECRSGGSHSEQSGPQLRSAISFIIIFPTGISSWNVFYLSFQITQRMPYTFFTVY